MNPPINWKSPLLENYKTKSIIWMQIAVDLNRLNDGSRQNQHFASALLAGSQCDQLSDFTTPDHNYQRIQPINQVDYERAWCGNSVRVSVYLLRITEQVMKLGAIQTPATHSSIWMIRIIGHFSNKNKACYLEALFGNSSITCFIWEWQVVFLISGQPGNHFVELLKTTNARIRIDLFWIIPQYYFTLLKKKERKNIGMSRILCVLKNDLIVFFVLKFGLEECPPLWDRPKCFCRLNS